METIDLSHIYNIYSVANPDHHPRLMGRIVATGSEISVLADYTDAFGQLEGPATPRRQGQLDKWLHGSHTFGVTLQSIKEGQHPDLIQEEPLPKTNAGPVSEERWFKVQRDDLQAPIVLRFKEGKAYQAGSDQPLSPAELQRLLELTKAGKASIRHHQPVEQMISLMKSLRKAEEPVEHEHDDSMAEHLFQDPMVPGVGNKKAFKDAPQQPGVYVMLNGNGTGAINRIHGHAMGDKALRAMGDSVRGSLDEVAGKTHKDVWRMVGDQFMVNLPSHEHAAQFLRTLRSKLEAVPPVGGTHKLSMNAGLGPHPMSARQALSHADQTKKDGHHLPGQSPAYAHSLMPGSEGPIAIDPDAPKKP